MRLGAYPCDLRPESLAARVYGAATISERHRHRFEFNPAYRDRLAENGMIFSGQSPDGKFVEIIELSQHPWFLACQFHPELKSKPLAPHPLFTSFIQAAHLHRLQDEAGEEKPIPG
jgi:CTP synthase